MHQLLLTLHIKTLSGLLCLKHVLNLNLLVTNSLIWLLAVHHYTLITLTQFYKIYPKIEFFKFSDLNARSFLNNDFYKWLQRRRVKSETKSLICVFFLSISAFFRISARPQFLHKNGWEIFFKFQVQQGYIVVRFVIYISLLCIFTFSKKMF